jgi:hypothetical protein
MEELLPHPTSRRAALKFLRWLQQNPGRPNSEVIQEFGLGLAWVMLRGGYATNPLGRFADAQTNLWQITKLGSELVAPNKDK